MKKLCKKGFSLNDVGSFDFITSCRQVISLDSSPQASTVELVDYLENLANKLGFHVEVQKEFQNGILQSNIIVRYVENQPGQLEFLLQTHLDTVDPGNFALWKKNSFNPYDAVIEDGQIYGLGSAEVKLDFICKLQAMLEFKQKKFTQLQPVLIGTFGEETGMQGALKLIRKNKVNAKYALVGEPTNLQLINAGKGFATVEIRIPFSSQELMYKAQKALSESTSTQTKVFAGKSAHSSTPHLGDSAAIKLFEYLQKLPDNIVIIEADAGTRFNMIPHQAMVEIDVAMLVEDPVIAKINAIYKTMQEVEKEMKSALDPDFTPEHSTLTVGIVRTFDDYILIGGSCRILPNVKQEQYEKWMKMISDCCDQQNCEFHLQDYKKPFRTRDDSMFVRAAQTELEKMNLNPHLQTLASTNEASLFSRRGIECLCFGPGQRENNVHTPNEHVSLDDLAKATEFYKRMIERFCL